MSRRAVGAVAQIAAALIALMLIWEKWIPKDPIQYGGTCDFGKSKMSRRAVRAGVQIAAVPIALMLIWEYRTHLLLYEARLQSLESRRKFSKSARRHVLELQERGVLQTIFPDVRYKELEAMLKSPQTVYCGFDPTADSLHIGNLLVIIGLIHLQRHGHKPIAVVGGATAQIGDPSGRSTERVKMDIDAIEHNTESITDSLHRIFRYHENLIWKNKEKKLPETSIMNNVDWYRDKNIIKFLSNVGRKFRMRQLLSKQSDHEETLWTTREGFPENFIHSTGIYSITHIQLSFSNLYCSVQTRLSSEDGMNFAEFTYQIFQAYDWYHLLTRHKCRIQIGGNDQLGNIVAGSDLIGKMTDQNVFGLTVPLVTESSGEKIGKSHGNPLWLNPDKSTPYELYQYFINLQDSEVEHFLKLFTFLSIEEIENVMKEHSEHPENRMAQKTVAEQVTLLVHGGAGLHEAKKWTEAFFSGDPQAIAKLTKKEAQQLFKSAKTVEIFLEPGVSVLDVVIGSKMFERTVDAIRVIKEGGVTMNHSKVTDPHALPIRGLHILPNEITLLRVGKKKYTVVKWIK